VFWPPSRKKDTNFMTVHDQRLTKFFADYETRTNRALADVPQLDMEEATKAFADCFIAADPNGVTGGKNDAEFRETIPKGFEFYRSIGTKSMKIVSLTTTPLDEFHVMVKVRWEAFYQKKDNSKEVIEFDVIYFLQTTGNDPKIFAYITGDEQKIYREKGLLPG
jgi:hypothetical protein